MDDKSDEIGDGEIRPGKTFEASEILGDYWRIWKEETECFLEFDQGHFATEMVTIEISQREYDLIASRPSAVNEVVLSRQRGESPGHP